MYVCVCVTYLVNISQWLVILNEHLSKLRALLWVHAHDVTQQKDVVRGVTHFLGVQHNLLELTGLSEALNDL